MLRRAVRLILFPALVLALAAPAAAQVTTASIAGLVTDSSGALVPGAEIVIINQGTGITRTMQSDAQGRYDAPNLALGNYEIVVTAPGFKTEIRGGVTLTVGQRALLNFTLEPGAISEQITVISEAPLVDTASAQVGALVTREQIRDMPLNGRDYTQLAVLQPGVVAYREQEMNPNRGLGVRFSISGARHNQVGFRLNGIDIGDGAGTTPGSAAGRNLGVDAIQEFQVLTNTFTAEQGRSAGGVVNIVHKSGTNELHGSAFEYHRNSAMDARSFFDTGDNPPPFTRHQFGFSAGGPIMRNRTFFFGAYEGLRERLTSTAFATVLSEAAKNGALGAVDPRVRPYLDLTPNPNAEVFSNGTGLYRSETRNTADEDYFVGKVDHTFSNSDNLSGSYTFDKAKVTSPNAIGTWAESNANRFHYLTLQQTHIFSSNTLHTIRGGMNRSRHFVTRDPLQDVPDNLRFVPGAPAGQVGIAGVDALYIVFDPFVFRELDMQSYQVANTLNWIRGAHSFKAGMEASFFQVSNSSFGRTGGGDYGFESIGNWLGGRVSTFEANDPAAETEKSVIHQQLYGFYVQDDIRVSSNFTLNAGVRYEFITTPQSTRQNQSNLVNFTDPTLTTSDTFIKNPSLKNVAPRAGFAWDVFGNQRTALRGGAGMYHDQITSYYYLPVVEANPPFRLTRTISNAPFPNGYDAVASGSAPPLFSLQLLQYDLKQPYRVQYNLGLQQQLGDNFAAAVYYVGARSMNSSQFFLNANSRPPAGRTPDGRLFFRNGDPRRNPNFGTVQYRTTNGKSWYESLQLVLQRRPTNGLSYQVSYTLQESTDTGSILSYSEEGQNTVGAQSIWEAGDEEKGLSSFDVRHTLSFNANYDLPFGRDLTGVAGALASGWQMSGIVNVASGHPFTPVLGFDNARTTVRSRGDDQRPDLIAGGNPNPVRPGDVSQYFDPNQFALPPAGTLGNLPRNTIIGPGVATVDLSLKKRFRVGGSRTFEFRAEGFNILNRANFRIPARPQRTVFLRGGSRNSSAGRITDTTTTARQIQVSLRFEF